MNTNERRAIKRTAKESISHLGIERFRVLYLKAGKEHKTNWFNSGTRAHQAREIMASKYGQAIVYVD